MKRVALLWHGITIGKRGTPMREYDGAPCTPDARAILNHRDATDLVLGSVGRRAIAPTLGHRHHISDVNTALGCSRPTRFREVWYRPTGVLLGDCGNKTYRENNTEG